MRLQIRQFILAATVAVFTLAAGCSADDPHFAEGNGSSSNGSNTDISVGYCVIENLLISDDDLSVSTTKASDSVDADSFIVIISQETTDVDTGEIVSTEVYKDTYANAKSAGQMEFEVGNYTIQAMSCETMPNISTRQEYKSNTYDFTIGADKVTIIDEIICNPATVKASATISADLISLFDTSDSAETELSIIVEYGTVSYTYTLSNMDDEIYFSPQDGVSTITITLVGMYNTAEANEEPVYEAVTWVQELTDVDSGQYREISIVVSNFNEGKINIEVTVKSWVTDTEIGVSVTNGLFYAVVEDEIEDSEDIPSIPESETLIIDWPGYSFGVRHTIYQADDVAAGATNPTVAFNITSETGITAMTVKIISGVLTAEELAKIGLQQSLDLVNPGSTESGLNELGFPTGDDVKGKTYLSFDISSFMPMLAAISDSGDETDFIITVQDESGYCSETLMVVVY